MSYNSFRNDNNGPGEFALIQFRKSNNFVSVAALDLLGQVLWSGYDATTSTYKSASYIYCQATGAPAGNVPSELQFNTSFGTGTQLAMTIGENGQVTISNPNIDQATLFLNNNQTSPNLNLRTANGTAVNSPHIHFTRSRAGTADVLAADDLGRLEFRGYQGGVAIEAATIRSQAETVNGASVSGNFQFLTRPTTYAALDTRMNISANGAVTINNPAINTTSLVVKNNLVVGAGSDTSCITMRSDNDTPQNCPILQFDRARAAATNVAVNDRLGRANFSGYQGGSLIPASDIISVVQAVNGSSVSSNLQLRTRPTTFGSLSARLQVQADGNIIINTPITGQVALLVNAWNAAGVYAQQNTTAVAGGIFAGLSINNTSSTAGSGSRIDLQVNGQAVSGGDPELRFYNAATQTVSIGLDTSVNQLGMSTGALGDAGSFFTYDIATTQINKPRQCAFLAYIGADVPDCTGNGIIYTLGTPTVAAPATPRLFTEVYDQSNNFNTNGTFTAPKSGRYHFNAAIRVFGTGGLATGYQIRFSTTGGLIIGGQGVPSLGSGFFTATCSAYINMTTADTCILQIQLTGMVGDTADINGASSVTYFGGTLVC